MNIKTLDQLMDTHYGVKGTKDRDRIERELEAFRKKNKVENYSQPKPS